MPELTKKLKALPTRPGVYLFKDFEGEVLYVGKAKNLKNRVRSYFPPHPSLSQPRRGRGTKEEIMLRQIADLNYIIVSSELESLMLENNLIKQYRPRFNVRMRDDKNYQFIKIDYSTEIPQVYTTRRITPPHEEGLGEVIVNRKAKYAMTPSYSPSRGGITRSKYFGPYTSGLAVRQTLKLIRRIFHLCASKKVGSRPCFYYHLGRCPGVCIGQVSLPEYRQTLRQVEKFLNHKQTLVIKGLKRQMQEASRARRFEKAAALRDKIRSLEAVWQKQKIVFARALSEDYFSLYLAGEQAIINLFAVREGKIIHQEIFELLHTAGREPADILQSFFSQYYAEASDRPKSVVTRYIIAGPETLEKWIGAKLVTAKRGKKLQLLALGEENAEDYYQKTFVSPERILSNLQKLLNLPRLPRRIEAFDISNIQGFLPVGSMVVFEDGEPRKSEYRKFKINLKQTPDDVAMMREMLTRRFKHSPLTLSPSPAGGRGNVPSPLAGEGDPTRVGSDEGFWPLPNLIVIDGGKGQLNAALRAAQIPISKIQISMIGLAKRLEEIYLPGRKHPLRLPPNSPVLQLLQRVRDEAHRFAITFYRKRHRQYETRSRLDEVPGVGPVNRKKLLEKFGSISALKDVSLEALAFVVGIKLAKKIKEYF